MAEDNENAGQNGRAEDAESYERELAEYLQERIKPGLNSGAIPLLARSIAHAIAQRERPGGGSGEDDETGGGEEAPDFEADMRELQQELGDEWILRFSVHGDDAWLTAEKEDGSEKVDAETADELLKKAG